MSKELRDFAAAFTPALQMGMNWRNKVEANRIDAERNKLKAQSDAIREARENRRLDIYAQSVGDAGILARARAEAALRPKGGGGGGRSGKAEPLDNPGLDALNSRWNARDAEAGRGTMPTYAPPRAPSAGNVTNVTYEAPADTSGEGVPEMPVAGVQHGGMIRKMAAGGSIEQGAGMTIEQALHYGDKPKASGGGDMSGLANAVGKGMEYYAKQNKPEVTPTGSQGSGAGGVYTTGDSGPGGILSRGLPPAAPERQPWDEKPDAGATWPVRQYKNGGRVMQAIDTGTSGPGSGFGYRASPPAGRR